MTDTIEKRVADFLTNPRTRDLITESFEFWLSVSQTRAFSAGMCAQEFAESSGNIKALGDHGHAFGLFQFHPDRCDAIKRGCGIDLKTFPPHRDQLRAAWWELQHAEKHAYTRIAAAKTAFDAGHDAALYWERPGSSAEWEKRGKVAAALLAYFDAHDVGNHRTDGHA